jgi:hypothetical protein
MKKMKGYNDWPTLSMWSKIVCMDYDYVDQDSCEHDFYLYRCNIYRKNHVALLNKYHI